MISALRQRCSVYTSGDSRVPSLECLPGVFANENRHGYAVRCFPDAVVPVRSILLGWGLPAKVILPDAFRAAHALRNDAAGTEEAVRACPELAPTVDATGRTAWDWMAPFQQEGVTRARAYGGVHVWQDPGAGKTVQEIIGAWMIAARAEALAGTGPRPILFITKAAVRYQLGRQIRRFTTCTPYVYHPKAGPFGRYLQTCGPTRDASSGIRWERRPVLVFAWTDLREWWEVLVSLGCVVWVGDETHEAKAWQRETWTEDASGRPKGNSLGNLSWAAGQLAKGIPNCIAATATDVDNRLNDLWAQLDLVQPGGWSRTARKFIERYCGAVPRVGGGMILGEPTNEAELRSRLDLVAYRVPESITKAGLPEKRRTSLWIPAEEQVHEAGGFVAEIRAADKAKGPEAEERRVMIRVAQAASRKRRFITDYAVDRLEHGQRWLILDVWRKNLEILYESIGKAWKHSVRREDGVGGTGLEGDAFLRENLFLVMGGDQEYRDQVQRRWMGEGGYPAIQGPGLVLGTIGALGTGLDWHRSHGLGFSGLPYKPGQLKQAEDRIWRRGLLELMIAELIEFFGVEIVFFIAEGTYDERIVEILLSKLPDIRAAGGNAAAAEAMSSAIAGIEGHEDEIDAATVKWLASLPDVDD